MEQPATPSHEECARLARQKWEEETDPKRKEFLGKLAQMWAELAAVKKLEQQLTDDETAAAHSDRLVG